MILKSVLLLLIVHKLTVTRAEGCGPPPVVEHTKPIEGTFPLNQRLRYECVTGFIRQAGTSSLITCIIEASQYVWNTKLPLTCIAHTFEPKVVLPKITPKPIEYIKTSTGKPPPTIAQNSTHATTSGKPHTTHTSLAPKAVSVATNQATSKSITFPIVTTTTTTTTTTTAWEEAETTGVNAKPPSTVSYDRLSPSPSHSSQIDNFPTIQAFSNQSAVVRGSVSAVVILLSGSLLFLFYKKKVLPWQQSRNTTDRPATYHSVAMGTTSQANTNPSCGISLRVQEASDGPDPAP